MVTLQIRALLASALAIVLVGASHDAPPLAFVDLPKLVALHPMHPVLAAYDRSIAALRGTLSVPGLETTGAQAAGASAALARDVGSARSRIQNDAQLNAAADSAREGGAVSTVLASQDAAGRTMQLYQSQLARVTESNIASYERSVTESIDRAVAARKQQLREKELALAFELARANAGTRLSLRLRLEELHADAATRAQLESQLASLDARDSQAIAAMERSNAAVLADYTRHLQRDGAGEVTQMAARLRTKAAANLALRRRVLYGEVTPAEAAAFRKSDRPGAEAAAVAGDLQKAGSDISQHFNALAESAHRSNGETMQELRALEAKRNALRQAIVAQILREAQALARERHLGAVATSASPPAGSVDLTRAVAAELARY